MLKGMTAFRLEPRRLCGTCGTCGPTTSRPSQQKNENIEAMPVDLVGAGIVLKPYGT